MKTSREILDTLGQKIVENCYDGPISHVISLRNKTNAPIIFKEKVDFLRNLDEAQFNVLKKIIGSSVEIVLFELFTILEENQNNKIIYEEDEMQVNLNKISEMLKAEHHNWIPKYSKLKTETD